MSLLGGFFSIKAIPLLLLVMFAILAVGYAFGRITIKGVSLGDAGVFIIALLSGALFFEVVAGKNGSETFIKGIEHNYTDAISMIETLGLVLFVTAVGFIAGPKFFGDFKKNFKSYVLIGAVIIISGGFTALACIGIGSAVGFGGEIKDLEGFVALITGLLAGALTSTPAFSAAKGTVAPEYESIVSVGYGIAYIFGVIGVVLFVQLIPKLVKADMQKEVALLTENESAGKKKSDSSKLFQIDSMGIAVFAIAAVLGSIIGQLKLPLSSKGFSGTCFSLTTTGGCLLLSLVLGHFGKIGKLSIMPKESTLKLFRELGLVFFLAGAGIPGGAKFVEYFDAMYFVYGAVMTIVPMIIGYLFAKYVLKLNLLNSLGSITGGMTSTPALGTLINVSKTDNVAAAYASTYPIALVLVVLVSQFLIILF